MKESYITMLADEMIAGRFSDLSKVTVAEVSGGAFASSESDPDNRTLLLHIDAVYAHSSSSNSTLTLMSL